mmetsp:Transcript_81856/g.219828  ORF Transcript_81856/g.219828 Transcript_81856/m.219828 type:complete len:217 (-) Transcript_81856:516-1166(-)
MKLTKAMVAAGCSSALHPTMSGSRGASRPWGTVPTTASPAVRLRSRSLEKKVATMRRTSCSGMGVRVKKRALRRLMASSSRLPAVKVATAAGFTLRHCCATPRRAAMGVSALTGTPKMCLTLEDMICSAMAVQKPETTGSGTKVVTRSSRITSMARYTTAVNAVMVTLSATRCSGLDAPNSRMLTATIMLMGALTPTCTWREVPKIMYIRDGTMHE